jgi:chitinase
MNFLGFNVYGDPSVGLYTFRNEPPTVSITRPQNGQAYPAGANVTIEASASDDGSVARVEFYQGGVLLGADTTSPYGMTWYGVPAGSYSLTAKAYDDAGASATSAPVAISVSGNATLLVVGSTTLTSGDALLKTRLQSQGFTVTVKASSAIQTSDAAGVTNPSHHMAGGQTGTITVTASAQTFNWGKPNAAAVKVATILNNSSRSAVFGYERGAAMPGLAAPGRRVGWFASSGAAGALNAAGKELLPRRPLTPVGARGAARRPVPQELRFGRAVSAPLAPRTARRFLESAWRRRHGAC